MGWFGDALRHNPELAIFLTLALGFFIGRLKIGSFSLGTVVGTLLAGVLVGQLGIQVPPLVKTVFFDLFLFTTGYKVGPQFFRGLKKDAFSQVDAHRGPVRDMPDHRVRGLQAPGLRPGYRRRAPGRGLLGVDGHRNGRRGDQSPGDLRRGKDAAGQQHPHRLRRDLPARHRRAGLVHSRDRSQAHGHRPEGPRARRRRPRRRVPPRPSPGSSPRLVASTSAPIA